jgi:hypothetical protein
MNQIGARSKFHGEQDARYGSQLNWPGNGYGIPFRSANGEVPLLKPHEYEKLQVVGDFHVGQFDLTDADHLANYIWVRDREANGLFKIVFMQRFWDSLRCRMIVYIEWVQLVSQLPPRTMTPADRLPVF